MAVSKYVEGQYKKLKVLMKILTVIQTLSFEDCNAIFGVKKSVLKDNIYKRIANEAQKG